LSIAGYDVRPYSCGKAFCDDAENLEPGCVLLDLKMPDFDGFQVMSSIGGWNYHLPIIVVTGFGDMESAIRSIRLGAFDFIKKPYNDIDLNRGLSSAFCKIDATNKNFKKRNDARESIRKLSVREYDVLERLAEGMPNKVIAYDLGLSIRTVEVHRSNMMKRLKAKSLSDALKIFFLRSYD
jgi:two-component system, LuxR family, response regulator FixJ